ncbi:MAG TPA: TIGR03364 family FAD-dependent oxidoreductase [Candidatus Acidoferrales bacterium]|nr:TIGR03364 family FAD-dependent oxidoreductase [Candidatus Acidoferrales bacterium]
MTRRADVAVIGGGILGLAHAYVLARSGKRVVLFERNLRASGASIRNFGMIWPIGQPAGEMHALALRSREIWLDALQAAKLNFRPTGSLHVAHKTDEAEVLQEFAEVGPAAGYRCQWLSADATMERSEAVQPVDLQGSLWSETELTVDPREVIGEFPTYLRESGVDLRYGSLVRRINLPLIETGPGNGAKERWEVDTAIVCGGDDFETLYPETFAASGLTRCKLQMMRTGPQPGGWQLGPSLASGLTLRFYKAFSICKTLPALRARIAAEKPEYDRWAIHLLASQTADRAITLGDSHEYGLDVDIFNKSLLDDLILREAALFLRIPSWLIAERWHGVYSLHPERPFFEAEPAPGVRIVTAPGGSGMTLSFGLADRTAKAMA